MSGFDSVLLIAFGGPERAPDIRPFLQVVVSGRRIPPDRIEEVARHYEEIGGRSPFNELTRRQAEALRSALHRDGIEVPVHVGMRNWHPFLHETLGSLGEQGHRRVLGVILSSFQTEASWDRYKSDVAAAREKVGASAPEVAYAVAWSDHPRFIEAVADRAADALARMASDRPRDLPIVFTAHSVPLAMAEGSPYASQFERAARLVAERLGCARWRIAYQSRSGLPREPWLGPDVGEVIRGLADEGAREVVVSPIGFTCDHVEVLYDLDVEARREASGLGVTLYRAAALNDHPSFIAMLVDLVRRGPAPDSS